MARGLRGPLEKAGLGRGGNHASFIESVRTRRSVNCCHSCFRWERHRVCSQRVGRGAERFDNFAVGGFGCKCRWHDRTVGFRVRVNGQQQNVAIAPDGSFVLESLPTGDVIISFEALGRQAEIVVRDVRESETLRVSVHVGESIVIEITSRDAKAPREIPNTSGEPFFIDDNNVSYWLRAGNYDRTIVVRGNHVSLFGSRGGENSCGVSTTGTPNHTVLRGDLVLLGNKASVYGVELQGGLIATATTRASKTDAHVAGETAAGSASIASRRTTRRARSKTKGRNTGATTRMAPVIMMMIAMATTAVTEATMTTAMIELS